MKALGIYIAALAILAMVPPALSETIVEGPNNILVVAANNADDIANNGYEVIDILPNFVIQKSTDGDYGIKVKGKTVNNGNGGNTTFGKRAIPDALCLKGRDWACDDEVMFAITTGAAQSSHYLGDEDARQKYTDWSTKTTTHTGRNPLTNWFRTDVRERVLH